jgi:hypothetical protein
MRVSVAERLKASQSARPIRVKPSDLSLSSAFLESGAR